MEITSISTAYAMGTNDYAVKKNNDVERKSQTNIVEEYYEKLCKKFPKISFNTQGGVMPCSPGKTVVNISPDCLKKMAYDPEFAKEVEWNLSGEVAANSLLYSWAKRDGVELGGPTVKYDANGNRESSCGGMRTANASNLDRGISNSPNQKSASEKRRTKKREQEAYLEKIREKRKNNEEILEKLREKRNDIDEYVGERTVDSSLAVKAYTQMEFESADLLSVLDKKI